MRARLRLVPRQRLESGEKVFLGFSGLLGAVYLLTRIYGLEVLPRCHFRTLTGLPCATCGFSRGLSRLAALDLVGAVRYNVLVVPFALLFALALLHVAAARLARRRLVLELDRGASRAVLYASLGLLAANWIYQILWNGVV